ncbi:MAG: TIGR04076 family protein [Saccharofermentanales bacterium]|jgi:uncharacterized repeat protein (TIGR04076 family)
MPRCKITVVKKTYNADIVESYSDFGPDHPECPVFEVGQTFITGMDMPEGFCSWAWDDIHKLVFAVLAEGNFDAIFPQSGKEDRTAIACCTDGYRPVIFHLEPVD